MSFQGKLGVAGTTPSIRFDAKPERRFLY